MEGFGALLLAGYGCYEGRGIEKKAKEDVKVKQYEQRASKERLGFIKEKSQLIGSKKEKEKKKSQHVRVTHGLKDKIVKNLVVVKL